jgi:hypothetical protein
MTIETIKMINWRNNMDSKEFVDSLFEGYEETASLADFKEELQGNLDAKVESMVKKGMSREDAFAKASSELGDVSAIADDLSLKRKTAVFEEVYMDVRKYMTTGRIIAYVVFSVVALFGIIVAAIAYFASKEVVQNPNIAIAALFGSAMPFLVVAVAGFTFLGVTQETASMYPMSKKRAFFYALAVAFLDFGLFLMPLVYFGIQISNGITGNIFGFNLTTVSVAAPTIPFILPGVAILIFLGLSEKDRRKPWAKGFHGKAVYQQTAMFKDSQTEMRFGLFSGAIWLFAFGLFVLLGITISFWVSWTVFVFAVAFQLLLQGLMSKK